MNKKLKKYCYSFLQRLALSHKNLSLELTNKSQSIEVFFTYIEIETLFFFIEKDILKMDSEAQLKRYVKILEESRKNDYHKNVCLESEKMFNDLIKFLKTKGVK